MNLVFRCCFLVWLGLGPGSRTTAASTNPSGENLTPPARSIPWSDVGANATTAHAGDGLEVLALADGSLRLSCTFQRLEGDITREGLWLTSTSPETPQHRFRVLASGVRREGRSLPTGSDAWLWPADLPHDYDTFAALRSETEGGSALPSSGSVVQAGDRVQFLRPGLLEEYSVSVDGVRQDFVIQEPPAGTGELRLELALSGATAETALPGSGVVLTAGGRKIAYSRLRVTDAQGSELAAHFETAAPHRLAVVVNDAEATYPVRIDPTFSDANWISMGGVAGVGGEVFAILPEADGTLYIGGNFTRVRGTLANNVAKWNGSAWEALGQGTDHSVFALARLGNDLFVGGSFTNAGGEIANGIARWNGSAWTALGSVAGGGRFGSRINTLAVSGNSLYAGGRFSLAGGIIASNVARWNGVTWSSVGTGFNGEVYSLVPAGLSLYAGGVFRTAGSVFVNSVARWNGTVWSALGKGVGGEPFQISSVITLATSGTTLYAGGTFMTAGDVPAKRIARWNGTSWSALGSGIEGNADLGIGVSRLAVLGNTLYVGGRFTSAGGVSAFNFAKWSGTAWSAVPANLEGGPWAFAISKTNLLVGGNFLLPNRRPLNGIAKLVGNSWTNVDTDVPLSVDAPVLALGQLGTNLLVGGSFTSAGGKPVNSIVAWSNAGWTNLGSGFSGPVSALAQSSAGVYAGGDFRWAGAVTVNNIARWSGGRWSPVGQGFIVPVTALATSGEDVYAGGALVATFPTSAQVGRWDGLLWRLLGTGFTSSSTSGEIYSLLAVDGGLFAGGRFTTTGRTSVQNIARWDGTAWRPVGQGLNGAVRSMLWWNGGLLVGGEFTRTAGTGIQTAVSGLAQWTGTAWAPLGFGANGSVNAMAIAGSRLVLGGSFTQVTNAAGQTVLAKHVAIGNGSEWSALGAGLNGSVVALSVSGAELWVGGYFSSAGGKVSPYVARAILPRETKISDLRVGENEVTLSFSGDPAQTYDVQRAGTLGDPEWLTINLNPLRPDAEGRLNFVDPAMPAGTAYYRIVER